MKILYLEERASIFTPLKNKLEENGHQVFKAIQVSDAISIFRENEIDFFIIDLRVIPIGLSDDEINLSRSGRISGWLFLNNYVFSKSEKYRKKTVIFTGYLSELQKNTSSEDLKDIKIFSKGDSTVENVFNYITNIMSNTK